ncbi:MAG: dihydrofolate reductase family protein [bacterium]|nr:dihydrofolate reductase family protein [bacterium]
MKTILYMGISANGYIAREDGNSEFTSEEDLKGFYEHSKSAGNIIMGKNTYLEASRYGYFPFPNALNIVVSNQDIENKWGDDALITNKSPKDILNILEVKNFKTAFLAGGGKLNSSFLKERLVDEIYLDVEPLIFGKGIKVFADADFEYDLELIEMKNLNKNTVQLHYKILK